MNERLQIEALTRAFLGRFFENEISDGTRDVRSSFTRMVGMLAAPGFLLPFANLYRWSRLASEGGAVLAYGSLSDKTVYLCIAMAAAMLLTAVVWQALLVDRRDAIVLGSFPVRPRTIIASKILALLLYIGIVAAGMNVIASLAYGMLLGGGIIGMLRAIPAHFIASTLACMFACVSVAAFQATVLALGGPRLFARVTASAQLVLAATALILFFMCPLLAGAAADIARGNARSAWMLWAPPMWFLGVYEVIVGRGIAIMPAMAARALLFMAAMLAVLAAMYPIAYRRIASAAIQGSPLGSRRSIAGRALDALVRRLPVRRDVRGAVHFVLLTAGRVARNKLIVATALGAAVAISMPFILRWAGQGWVPSIPARSHIAVPFVFMMFGLAGLRMAYNVPSESGAAWIFSTAVRPARIGAWGARVTALLITSAAAFLVFLPICVAVWGLAIGASMALTIFAFGLVIAELGLHGVTFVPFTRPYNPERGKLQARWPMYLIGFSIAMQFFPWVARTALMQGAYWFAPLVFGLIALGIRLAHPPEPPPLVDADLENKPLALRLY